MKPKLPSKKPSSQTPAAKASVPDRVEQPRFRGVIKFRTWKEHDRWVAEQKGYKP
jgi:hypothetical protein